MLNSCSGIILLTCHLYGPEHYECVHIGECVCTTVFTVALAIPTTDTSLQVDRLTFVIRLLRLWTSKRGAVVVSHEEDSGSLYIVCSRLCASPGLLYSKPIWVGMPIGMAGLR